MTNINEKNEIRKAIEDYCKAKSISRNELAIQIGVSSATLSNIVNEKWESIDAKMWTKINNHLKPTTAKIFNTSDFNAVMNLCNKVKENHFMAGLTAETGMGKTTALQAFTRKENVFYIYYDANMKPKNFFYELGKLMGYDYEANVYEQVKKACDTLNTLHNPLIIIDEAGKLTDAMLLTLHVLRDKTIKNCGIILAGMPYFRANLIKKANKQKTGISEFLRRVMIWNELEGLKNSEIDFICESHSITDKKEIARLRNFKRFGDLENEILLHTTINNTLEN